MPKLIAAVMTLLMNAVAGVVLFFMMMMGMNGFSESDANYGFAAYIVAAVLVTATMAALAVLAVHLLQKRSVGGAVAAIASVLVFSLVGSVLKVGCLFIGLLVADHVRVNY